MEEEDLGWSWKSYMKYIEDSEVAGDKVAYLIAEAATFVEDAMDHNKTFRAPLKFIYDELNFLELQLDKMGKDDDLMKAIISELKGIYFFNSSCKSLVDKCSNIYNWQFIDKRKATNEIMEMHSRLHRTRVDLEHTSTRWELWLVRPKDEVVTGGVVGELLGQTTMLMEEAISINKSFSDRLHCILHHMKTLQSKLDTIGKDTDQMNLPNEELRPIYDFLRRPCKILVFKSIKFPINAGDFETEKYCRDLDHLGNELASFCETIDLSYMIDTKAIKDEIVVESGGYGMNKLFLDEQVTAISYEYDVFLSFRGEDTRESFTGTLFHFLSKVHKVKTFMDVIFRKGSKLEDLLKMIEKSRMSIVVFSENFAESEWCLKELAKIFEESDRRGHEILPVFYKVNPSELRHQNSGKTKGHMEKHYNTYGKDSDTVKSWSNAMKELGNSSGYTYWSGRGKQEIELAEEIAQEILSRLHG